MGRVDYTELAVGAARSATGFTDSLDAIAVQSSNIEAVNIREEGLDHRNFVIDVSHKVSGNLQKAVKVGYTSATMVSVTGLIASVSIAAGEWLEIVGSIELETIAGSYYGIPAGGRAEIELFDGTIRIAGSLMALGANHGATSNGSLTTMGVLIIPGSYTVEMRIREPVAGGLLNVNNGCLRIIKWKRVATI